MKLILIHGRDQQQRTLEEIRTEWLSGLSDGLLRERKPPLSSFLDIQYDVCVPYYGNVLDDLTKGVEKSIFSAIAKGKTPPDSADREMNELVAEVAQGIGLQPEVEEVAGAQALAKGDPTQWASVQALARAWQRRWPGVVNYFFSQTFLRDVAAYCYKRHITRKVDEIVAKELRTKEPCVVVAHSLGTVVAYRILNEVFEKEGFVPDIRLFITAGSPLGLETVKRSFSEPLRFPTGVVPGSWYNVFDARDVVALVRELNEKTFIDGIANHSVTNEGGNPHRIARYLEHTMVIREVFDAWHKP